MITINDRQVLITLGGTRLVQTKHHITGEHFQSNDEAFKWIVESGWFQRYKEELIGRLHKRATAKIYRLAPLHKQINAALGIYDQEEKQAIKNNINSVREEIKKQETAINEVTTLAELTLIASDLLRISK